MKKNKNIKKDLIEETTNTSKTSLNRNLTNIFKTKQFKNLLILSSFLFIIEILFKLLGNSFNFNYTILRIFISSIIIGYFISLILNFIKLKWINNIILIVLGLIISVYAMLQLGFKNFIGNYVSINTSNQLGKVTDYIKDYLMSFDVKFYFILIPIILLILYFIFLDNKISVIEFKFNIKKFIVNIFIFIILCAIYYSSLTIEFMQNRYQSVKNTDLFKNPNVQNIAINQFGIATFGLLDIKSFIIKPEITANINYTPEEILPSTEREIDDTAWISIIKNETNETLNTLNNYFISRNITDTNDYTGMFEGKNLILIMMESVNNIAINEKYFPTFYKLANEGWYFKNSYSPRSSCATGNNEFSALTSLYSINTLCVSNIYSGNTYYESLFNVFNNKGYTSMSFHNYTDYYYDRKISHPNMGSIYYGVEDLGIEYNNEYKEWPSDVELIEKSYEIFSKEDNFAVLLTTVTSHQPYYVSSTYGDMYLDEFKDLKVSIYLKRYLSKLKVLDNALGLLLQKLENDNLLDDTVIVLFGDHYPYGLADSVLQPMFDYNISVNSEVDRTPFIIYNSQIESQEFDQYTTYINIFPTLANLFNLDYDPRLYMGEDLFDENYSNIAYFVDGSWQSPYAFYDSNAMKISYISDEYIYTDEEIKKINDMIDSKIIISNLAIKKNYFSYLKEKFEEYEQLKNSLNIP